MLCGGDCVVGGRTVLISGMLWVSAIMRRWWSCRSGVFLMGWVAVGVVVESCPVL